MVFPTLGDPNGLVVEEAMAAGLPVIASDAAGDIRTRVQDDVTGYVYPAGSVGELANLMLRVGASDADRKRLSAAAYERVQTLGVDRYAEEFAAFVDGVLHLPARRGPIAASSRILGSALVTLGRFAAITPYTHEL